MSALSANETQIKGITCSMDQRIAASEPAPDRRPQIQGGEHHTNRQTASHAQDSDLPKRPVPRQTKERDEPTTPDCPKYLSRTAVIPGNLTCYDICQQLPNHVWGDCLNHVIHHKYSASDIWECVPDDFKPWVKSHKSTKRSTETWRNGYSSAHTAAAEGEENSKHKEEDGGDEEIAEVEESENKKMDRNENTPLIKRVKAHIRRLKEQGLYEGVMKDPHTRSDGRSAHLREPGKGCSCASGLTVGGDEAEEATTASLAENALAYNHSTTNDETRARDDNAEDMTRPSHTIVPSSQNVEFGPPAPSPSYIKHGSVAPRPSIQQSYTLSHAATVNHDTSLPILVDGQLLNAEWTVIAHNSATVPVSKSIHGAIVKTGRVLIPRVVDNQEGPDALLQPKANALEVAVMGQVVGHEDNVEAVRDADVREAFGI